MQLVQQLVRSFEAEAAAHVAQLELALGQLEGGRKRRGGGSCGGAGW